MPIRSDRPTARTIAVTLLMAAAVLSLGGCAEIFGVGGDSDVDEPGVAELEGTVGSQWECYYDPTINDDWHDDVACSNGLESDRPILLPEQDFVTEADMIAAGNDYAAELNE